MSDDVEGWAAPLCQGFTEPHLLCGVPRNVFVVLFIGTALSLLWFWPLVLIMGTGYGLARLGTLYDPQWFALFHAHLQFRQHYEG